MLQIIITWVSILCLTLTMSPLRAQELLAPGKQLVDINPHDVIIWEAAQALRQDDGSVLVGLRLSTRDNFSIYKSRLSFEGPSAYALSLTNEPAPRMMIDPMGDGEVEVYDGGDFELRFHGSTPYAAPSIRVRVTSLGCTERICLFPSTKEFELPVYAETAVPRSMPQNTEASAAAPSPSDGEGLKDLSLGIDDPAQAILTAAPSSTLTVEEQYAKKLQDGRLPWLLVLLVVFLGGIATNLTPCVFPMIPITVRLLGKQGHRPIAASIVYASGIVVTYTALGLLASLSGGVFGSLLALPAVNIGFALLFIILGFTMLGFGNLTRLQNLGAQLGSGRASYLNAFGMGAGAGLVAAPCTGPIMGALLAYATQISSPSKALVLFFLYSLGFALPYVFLGLAAQRVAAYKVSPKLQVGVKMFFAAAMFALAVYYFKNVAHEALLPVQGYWQYLSLGLLGLGLLLIVLVVRHSHLIHVKSAHLFPAVILAAGLFAGIQWATGADVKSQLHWFKTEEEAYALAQKEGKPLLIDGWADWCVACKKMDQTTFNSPRVISLLQENWVLVKLDLTETNETTEALAEKYGMQGLPTLVLVPSDGDLTKSTSLTGYINDQRLIEELRTFSGQ